MKVATTIVRVLLGVLFIYASLMFFLKMAPEPETTGDFKIFNTGIVAAQYILPLAKTLEFLCGLAFLTNRFVALANLVILPVTINIFMIHFFMSPENLPIAVFVCIANVFLIFRYWDHYKGLFQAT